MEGKQVATDGVEACPQVGIHLPFHGVGAVEGRAPFSVEADDRAFHVFSGATLGVEVAVAAQGDVVAVNTDYSVQDEHSFEYLCQHSVADMYVVCFLYECLVASVFQEWTHASNS